MRFSEEFRRKSYLENKLSEAGDRRDWEECNRLEEELKNLEKRKWYQNWALHNFISHPVSEILYLFGFREKIYNWAHDITAVPDEKSGEGRG